MIEGDATVTGYDNDRVTFTVTTAGNIRIICNKIHEESAEQEAEIDNNDETVEQNIKTYSSDIILPDDWA